MTEIIGLIPARGGSKGIPKKNIRDLAGKPLIAWTIGTALKSKVCSRLIVTTEDPEIMNISREWGAEVPFIRPKHLAGDATTSIAVIHHAIEYLLKEGAKESDYILLLQPTSPLRNEGDIKNVIEIGRSKHAVAVLSVTESPYHPCKMHLITTHGVLKRFVKNNSADNVPRQNLPKVYAENGAVYLNRISSLLEEKTLIPENKTHPYIMPFERSIDIDTLWDFYLAELILKDQKNIRH
jgi:CMP-N,N'-diacetyllegionaminic acid synthase